LRELKVEGIKTTIPLHLRVLETAAFVAGEGYTDFVSVHLEDVDKENA